ncbi:hypothetical protein N7541_001042 [Penicillium brevicompactum]|uniref:Zinc-regulated transporter 1 n=1 Tax=Penicillium brevicompactum TaxID=5074 RepID=A0A9W9RVT4_PENBR|nr:hypothetical protein N7541_001042 [Penicillium brevicompactum]
MSFDPHNVDLDTADAADIVCYLNAEGNDRHILPRSRAARPRLRIPLYVYLFAKYFGAGVIIATAFIHLLDPAYGEIGSGSCVALTGHWADYSWCPAIVLTSLMAVFLMDFGAERYVEKKYGVCRDDPEPIMASVPEVTRVSSRVSARHSDDKQVKEVESQTEELAIERSVRQQLAALLILEFGVIFHSVIIGLNLGVAGDEFATLYPVLVFHQSFEGLGIGARMSSIPFKKGSWVPWLLCAAYGLTTPIAIAIGLGLRETYNPGSFTANVVSGVLDAISAGILLYTGLVELLARDFLFDPHRTQDDRRLTFMIVTLLLGAGIMALLGKWA